MGKQSKGGLKKRSRNAHSSGSDSDTLTLPSRSRRGQQPVSGGTTVNAAYSGASSNVKLRRHLHEKRDFAFVIAEDEADGTRTMSWQALNAGPSSYPPRRFCCVCGFEAAHKCAACFKNRPYSCTRFICSVHCSRIHEQTDCCKPRQWCTVV